MSTLTDRIALTTALVAGRLSYANYRHALSGVETAEAATGLSRQVTRRQEFDRRFVRLAGNECGTATRQERRKLARARVAGWWRDGASGKRGRK